jgi:hypothetical protein
LAPEAVLWNQLNSDAGGVASQYFPDNYYDIGFYSADDFENTGTWALDLIFIDGSWNGGGSLPNATSLNWYIYADAGGVPAGHPEDGGGTEFWSYSCAPGAPGVTISGAYNDDVTLDISMAQGSAVNLPAGHWWLVFFPSLNYTQYDQWFWDRAGSTNLADAQLIDPNNLFGYGWISWTSWYNVVDPGYTYDLAFRLEGEEVTAVTLASFNAAADGVGAIRLDWTTASEIDNLGFNVYRAEAADAGGGRLQLNGALIPAQNPGSAVGAAYSFVDETARPGVTYYYWLEDVDVNGAATLHGPVSAELAALRRLLPARTRPAPVGPFLQAR